MKYTTIYAWSVFDEMKKGAVVYALDKMEKEVIYLNDVSCDFAMRTIVAAEKDIDRVVFWKEETDNA